MKKIMLSIVLLLMVFSTYAQDNRALAKKAVEQSAPGTYAMIRARAIAEWDTDHEMVLYTIEKQCYSFLTVVTTVSMPMIVILVGAIEDWSYNDVAEKNIAIMVASIDTENNIIDMDFLLEIDADWTMIEYQVNKQVEASNKY